MAATVLARRIVEAATRLCQTPQIGRPGLRVGTREWVVQRTPYVLVYCERGDVLEVLHVWHAAQDWQHGDE